uniref:Uncharacterized protein n=1 Tax=Rhizophora mucronata TaxID=61149 RepID=A0A2P2N342_RHIMU
MYKSISTRYKHCCCQYYCMVFLFNYLCMCLINESYFLSPGLS